jgi:hypothetical protein
LRTKESSWVEARTGTEEGESADADREGGEDVRSARRDGGGRSSARCGARFVGDTLQASNGSWTGSPTSFKYQWDRCAPTGDRVGCGPIAGATSKSYTVQKADVDHTLRVRVTATNADGSATKDSKGTGVVSDKVAPEVKTRPSIDGSATVGSQLAADPGTWAGATSFAYQWQQCDLNGANCTAITGATSKTYTVRSADVDHVLRVEVTAKNRYGATKAYSTFTNGVTTGTPSTTTVVTTTVATGNRAPAIRFLSLKVLHNRVYVRFRVCDDAPGKKVTVTDRDQLTKRLAYTRKLAVHPAGCGTYSRNWSLIPRLRGHGKFLVTLRAIDKSGRLSRPASRSLHR